MRLAACIGTVLALALGCGRAADIRSDANDALREKARREFVEVCTRVGPGDGNPLSHQACTCVADRVLETHTTQELLKFAAHPDPHELAPIVKYCVRDLAR